MKKMSRFLILLIAAVSFFGCAAANRLIDYGSMKTDVSTGGTVFLTPTDSKTILIQIKNTSTNQNITPIFESVVVSGLQSRGYKIVKKTSEANYLLQANIRYLGEWKEGMNFGDTMTGAGLGALTGIGLSSPRHYGSGGAVGGIIGGALGFVADVATRVKTAVILIDLQIAEKVKEDDDVFGVESQETQTTSSTKSLGGMGTHEDLPTVTSTQKKVVSNKKGTKVYTTAVAAKAAQVNLDVNEAYKALIETAGRQVVGIF